jgi:succinate dehydrogenase/fumarate reductase flavoprotein subunit
MYYKVDEDPYTSPMMIYLAVHYMGGTWVDYNLMTTIQDVSLWRNQTRSRSKQTWGFCIDARFS